MRIRWDYLLAVLLLSNIGSAADTVVTYDGTTISGRVLRLKEGHFEIEVDKEKELSRIPLGDVSAVKLIPAPPDPKRHGSILLIDNDGHHAPAEKSGKIKLRKGLHVFWLLYFQGTQEAELDLNWEGPGIKKQKIPSNVLSKWKSNPSAITYSSGVDDEGFRLPDEFAESEARVGYKHYVWTHNGEVSEVGDLRNLTLKKYSTIREINLTYEHPPNNFGAMFYGAVKVPKDGEYTFHLKSDDGSQLYIGKAPGISQPTIRAPAKDEWLVRLDNATRLNLRLSAWDDQGFHGVLKLANKEAELLIPSGRLREVWSRQYADKQASVDRSDEPADADTVYATNADGQMQQVSGNVLGMSEESIKFEYDGQERSIGLDRVAAVIMRQSIGSTEPSGEPGKRVKIRFDLIGEGQFVGHLDELSPGTAVVTTSWGQSITISRNMIYKMDILNGRMQSLQELSPSVVAQTPFFDRILAWQSGKSLTGKPLQIGSKTYQKGLCLHSRTRLTYDLAGEYDRFQCDLGLQRPDGDAGNATVRIIADGTELFVAEEVTAADEPQPIDLDLTGKKQLTLDVDFGRNMHIGDHVVFGNARLLRPELAP